MQDDIRATTACRASDQHKPSVSAQHGLEKWFVSAELRGDAVLVDFRLPHALRKTTAEQVHLILALQCGIVPSCAATNRQGAGTQHKPLCAHPCVPATATARIFTCSFAPQTTSSPTVERTLADTSSGQQNNENMQRREEEVEEIGSKNSRTVQQQQQQHWRIMHNRAAKQGNESVGVRTAGLT